VNGWRRYSLSIAYAFLVVAVVVAFWRLQHNFDEHKKIDERICLAALNTRTVVAHTLEDLARDPGIMDPNAIAAIEAERHKILATPAENCHND